MFYFDLRHNRKQSSKSSFNGFCYITRTKHFKLNKIELNEEVEFVCSGNMPKWAEYKPDRGEFKHEVRQFEKSYDNQQAEQISLMV